MDRSRKRSLPRLEFVPEAGYRFCPESQRPRRTHLNTFQDGLSVSQDGVSHFFEFKSNKKSQTFEIRGDLPSMSCCSAQKTRSE